MGAMHVQRGAARRFLSRAGGAIVRLCARLSHAASVLSAALIGAAVLATGALYACALRPLLARELRAGALLAHTAASCALLLSAGVNYAAVVSTPAGAPPPAGASPARDDAPGLPAPAPGCDPAATARTSSETWRFCKMCRAPKPPRAHHCSACDACVLRMCHHCPAVGRCIGLRNYGWYFRFLGSALSGSVFGAGTCLWLVRAGGARLGAGARDAVFLAMLTAVAVAVAVGVLFAWHAYLLCTGQTTIECYENWAVHRSGDAPPGWSRWGGPFDGGFRANVRDAFGDPPLAALPWWSVLVLPVPRRMAPQVGVI